MLVSTQICGLILILMLIFFYNRQLTLGLRSEMQFKRTLYVILVCLTLDFLSCYTISHSYNFSRSTVILIAKLYLVSLETVSVSALIYSVAEYFQYKTARLRNTFGIIIIVIHGSAVIYTLFLDLNTYYDGLSLYSYGPSAIATYTIVAIYLISTLVATIALKNHMKPKKQHAIWLWMGIWMGAAVIQYLYPKFLFVGYASAAGALVVYFMMENPDASISRRTGHFSSAVIREYFDYMYQTKKSFSVMMISFMTVADSASDTRLLRKSIEMLSEFLFTIKDCKVFDTTEGYFVLVFENSNFLESTKFKINTYFQSIESNTDIVHAVSLLNPYYTIVPDCSISSNGDELLNVLTGFIPNDHKSMASNEVIVDRMVMADVRKRKQVENMVISAMENDQIEVFYQPIYDVAKDSFTSAEALVRIRLKNGKLVFPGEFIPIVEQTGRIIPLQDAIYRKTLSFMKSYRVELLGVERIELNLSMKQIENNLFASRFEEMLSVQGISPQRINLELTEASALGNIENLLNNMKRLDSLGIEFTLDDFGNGAATLNYIVDMPVKAIKLDRHLIKAYSTSDKAKAVVDALVTMAKTMDIKIVAKGIENTDELALMHSLGVDYIQGYFFSKPLPEHEFLKFMQSNNLK